MTIRAEPKRVQTMADYSTRGCEAANKAPVPAGPDDAYAGAAWGKGARERPPRRAPWRRICGSGPLPPVASDGPLAALHRRVRGGRPAALPGAARAHVRGAGLVRIRRGARALWPRGRVGVPDGPRGRLRVGRPPPFGPGTRRGPRAPSPPYTGAGGSGTSPRVHAPTCGSPSLYARSSPPRAITRLRPLPGPTCAGASGSAVRRARFLCAGGSIRP